MLSFRRKFYWVAMGVVLTQLSIAEVWNGGTSKNFGDCPTCHAAMQIPFPLDNTPDSTTSITSMVANIKSKLGHSVTGFTGGNTLRATPGYTASLVATNQAYQAAQNAQLAQAKKDAETAQTIQALQAAQATQLGQVLTQAGGQVAQGMKLMLGPISQFLGASAGGAQLAGPQALAPLPNPALLAPQGGVLPPQMQPYYAPMAMPGVMPMMFSI